jgi:DNA-binding beta-propeller fold protein YncE
MTTAPQPGGRSEAAGSSRLVQRTAPLSFPAATTIVVCLVALGGGCSASGGAVEPSATVKPEISSPADVASPTSTNRLGPGGSISNTSGVPTFVDGAVWLPLGSELSRIDSEGNAVPTDTDLVRIDPASGAITARVPLSGTGSFSFALGDDIVVKTSSGADVISSKTLRRERKLPGGRVFGFGSAWDIGGRPAGRRGVEDNTTLLRIDPESGKITGRAVIQDDETESGHSWNADPELAVGAGAIWVGVGKTRSVLRVDPKTLRREASIELDEIEDGIVVGFGFGSVWAHQSTNGAGKLYRIDPATNRVTATVDLGDPSLGSSGGGGGVLAFSDDSVWTCDSSGTITEVDPGNATVRKVQKLPFDDCIWLTVGAGSIWVSNDHNSMQPMTLRINL